MLAVESFQFTGSQRIVGLQCDIGAAADGVVSRRKHADRELSCLVGMNGPRRSGR